MKLSLRISLPFCAFLLLGSGCSDDAASEDDGIGAEDGGSDDVQADDDDEPADDEPADDDDEPADDDDEPADDAGHGAHEDDDLPDPHAIPEDAGTGVLECALLASQCHEYARGLGDLGDECHGIGHEGEPNACLEAFDECIAFCSPDAGGGPAEPVDAGAPMCEEIGHLCHELGSEPDAGLAAECHEVGHAGDEAACDEIYDACFELCGGHEHSEADAGHAHEATDGGVSPADAGLDASAADGG